MAQLQYASAAEHFKQAAALVPSGHPNQTADYLHHQADALDSQGYERGDNAALRQSIETWYLVLQYLARDRVPLDWATTQNSLGNALSSLGERESGTARLEQAVAAWKACLTVATSAWRQNGCERCTPSSNMRKLRARDGRHRTRAATGSIRSLACGTALRCL
jgi:hypothetical protein